MIAANQTVFRLLSDHSVRHGNPVQSPEKIRFIASTGRDKEYLKNLKIGQSIRFGRHRSLSSLSINQDRLVGLVGFDFEPDLPELTYIGGDAGTSVALISEMQPHPIASPAQIRNIVEAGDKSVEGYTGHRIADVAPLFPPIQIWQTNREDSSDSIWQLFLSVCVHECQRG
ncbi:hypothetical protein GS470_04285 [Rhodococcus hoagii]|nr:hypothetical protein [Prescottella equi]